MSKKDRTFLFRNPFGLHEIERLSSVPTHEGEANPGLWLLLLQLFHYNLVRNR